MREPACHLAARATARESGWAARRKPQTGLTVRRPPGAALFVSEKQMANRLDKDRDDRAVLRGGDEIRLHASRTQALCGGPLHIAFKPPAFKGCPRSARHAQFHSFASTDPKPKFAPQSIAIRPSGKSAGAVFRGHEFAPVFNACMPFWKPAQDQKSIFLPSRLFPAPCKPYNLPCGINRCFNIQRNNTPRRCVPDIQVIHNRQIRLVYFSYQEALVFFIMHLIHWLSGKNAIYNCKNAGRFQCLQHLLIDFRFGALFA